MPVLRRIGQSCPTMRTQLIRWLFVYDPKSVGTPPVVAEYDETRCRVYAT